ncbi:MAG TPA: gamma carbonic anhydrase family protein [Nitrososphaerales archaeon]|nr:gamma carbonic anhydrase family protein [Nitrososphaerales archaeon]
MTVYSFENRIPQISDSSYVHETASVIGDVTIQDECFIGAGAVLRGDYGSIQVGARTSIQENSVIHARLGEVCKVGNDVQIGHGSVLHNCEIKDYAVVGLGSRICDYAVVGVWAIIGEGAVVTSRSVVPDGKVFVGVPAKLFRDVSGEDRKVWSSYKQKYVELCHRYKLGLKRIS